MVATGLCQLPPRLAGPLCRRENEPVATGLTPVGALNVRTSGFLQPLGDTAIRLPVVVLTEASEKPERKAWLAKGLNDMSLVG